MDIILVSIVLLLSWTPLNSEVVLFHELKFLRFLVLGILYFLRHWKQYVQMVFENMSVFLIGKHDISKLKNPFHNLRNYPFENFEHFNW